MSMEGLNVYLALGIAGFFSGLGNGISQYVYNKWLKRRFDRASNKVNRIIKSHK